MDAYVGYAEVSYYSTSNTSYLRSHEMSSPINLAYIDGTSLSLIGGIGAGTGIHSIQTFHAFHSSNVTSSAQINTLNETGYTYYYLAF